MCINYVHTAEIKPQKRLPNSAPCSISISCCCSELNADHLRPSDRDRAPPHAAVRGGVPAVRLPLDEQPPDEGAATALHDQTVGHLPGTHTHTLTQGAKLLPLCLFLSISISMWDLRIGDILS